ncbi:unnamed protein product [Scytosiphon promiscuus]
MRGHRPAAPHERDGTIRVCYRVSRRRRAVETRTPVVVLMLTAAVIALANAAPADSSAGHVRQRQQRGRAGFVAPLWASPQRDNEQHRTARSATGSSGRDRVAAHGHFTTSTGDTGSLWGPRGENGEHDEQHSSGRPQGVGGWLPHLRTDTRRRRASSALLLRAVGAVGTDVNATVGAEVSLPAATEVALSAASAAPAPAAAKTRKTKPKASKTESASVEGKEATVIITEAGGRPHTVASRAKISAANKGKKPWNVGVGHSEETRRKIAEGARNAAKKRREKAAESLGMTLEDYEEMKRRKPAGKRSPDVTEETRRKISTRLKEKWRDPAYRAQRKMCLPNRRGIPHTAETKARISAAVKKKWDDPIYREKITNMVRTDETRAKIGKVIREQWANPETREERMKNMVPRTKEHNKRIAASVRSKWLDPEYRKRTSEAMRKAAHDRIIASGGVPKPPRVRRPRVPRAPGEPRARASRLEGVGISREAQRNLNKWARQRKDAEVRLMRQARKEEKARDAAMKLAIKEAKAEAERIAQEEEAALTAGLDDLEKVLMRSTIRAKKQERLAKVAEAVAKAKAEAAPAEPEPEESEELEVQVVPEGFEMVEINGRMVMRMK